MVLLDYIILGSLSLGLFTGLWKGFFKQILAIAGIFLIGTLTSVLSPYPDKWLSGIIGSDWLRHIIAAIATFVVLVILYGIVTRFISRLVNKIPIFGWLNRLLGAIFSVATVYMIYAVIVAIVMGATEGFLYDMQDKFLESWFVNNIYGGLDTSKNFFGTWLVDMFKDKIAALFA